MPSTTPFRTRPTRAARAAPSPARAVPCLLAVAILAVGLATAGSPAAPAPQHPLAVPLQAPLGPTALASPGPDTVLDAHIGPGTVLAISKTGHARSPFGAASAASTPGAGPGVGAPSVYYGLNGCTANWLWKDQDANLYLGAAGHCLLPEGKTATHGPGADFDASAVRVYACATACPLGGASALAAAYAAPGYVELGPVAYARQAAAGAFGPDFGLVAVPSGLEGQLDPALKGWNGPTGVATIGRGDLLLLHGDGAGFGETAATKSRAGVFLHAPTDGLWKGNVPIATGDSGSPVGWAASLDGPVLAAGVATHAVCSGEIYGIGTFAGLDPCTAADVVAGGPTVAEAASLARDAGLCIEVVLAGEDLSALAPAADCFA